MRSLLEPGAPQNAAGVNMAIGYRCEIKQHGLRKEPWCPKCSAWTRAKVHRPWLKIVLNCFLRPLFGVQIVSIVRQPLAEGATVEGYQLRPYP